MKKAKSARPRVVKCGWPPCPNTFTIGPSGRPRRYCSPSCKTRDWMERNLGISEIRRLKKRVAELEAELEICHGKIKEV